MTISSLDVSFVKLLVKGWVTAIMVIHLYIVVLALVYCSAFAALL